jgi:hypothetical protein
MARNSTLSIAACRVVLAAVVLLAVTRARAAAGDVVINEVAWMGTTESVHDEWIELYNPTGQAIDVTGWTLRASDGSPDISLSGSVPARGYVFLLDRADDDTVRGIAADQIYSGALQDTGQMLELRDAAGGLHRPRRGLARGWQSHQGQHGADGRAER